jgi:hypothetical protein
MVEVNEMKAMKTKILIEAINSLLPEAFFKVRVEPDLYFAVPCLDFAVPRI